MDIDKWTVALSLGKLKLGLKGCSLAVISPELCIIISVTVSRVKPVVLTHVNTVTFVPVIHQLQIAPVPAV